MGVDVYEVAEVGEVTGVIEAALEVVVDPTGSVVTLIAKEDVSDCTACVLVATDVVDAVSVELPLSGAVERPQVSA